MKTFLWTLPLLAACSDSTLGYRNNAPAISLITPSEGQTFPSGATVPFVATVSDSDAADTESLEFYWASDTLGLLGGETTLVDASTVAFSQVFPEGAHRVTVTVNDKAGGTAEDSVSFTVAPDQGPDIRFTQPAPDARLPFGEPVQIAVFTSDDHPTEELELRWSGNAAEAAGGEWPLHPAADGTAAVELIDLAPGNWTLFVHAVDAAGHDAQAAIQFHIADYDLDDDGDLDEANGGGDCDDSNPDVSSATTERCNGIDDDCDGEIDEGLDGWLTWYADADGDGYGDPDVSESACSPPEGMVENDSDCDDAASSVHPDATERCDGIDNDCDEAIDEDLPLYFADTDGDGQGAGTGSCLSASGKVTDHRDCDDADSTVYTGAPERCDGKLNDCSGTVIDEGACACNNGRDDDSDGLTDLSDPGCSGPLDRSESDAIPQVCDYRWAKISPVYSNLRVYTTDTDLLVSGFTRSSGILTHAWKESDGGVRWERTNFGSFGANNSGTFRGVFQNTGGGGMSITAADLRTGTTLYTAPYTLETSGWSSVGERVGVQSTGEYLIALSAIPMSAGVAVDRWAITPTTTRVSDTGPAGILFRHNADGSFAGYRNFPGLTPVKGPIPLEDGRWTVYFANYSTSPISAFGTTVPGSGGALVTFSADLATATADYVGANNVQGLTHVPRTDTRVVRTWDRVYAYDDGGLLWEKRDTCTGNLIGASRSHVYVTRPATAGAPLCGVPVEAGSGGSGLAVLGFDIDTGALSDTRWLPTSLGSTGWAQGTVSPDGDVYLYNYGQKTLTVCGVTVASDTTNDTVILAY